MNPRETAELLQSLLLALRDDVKPDLDSANARHRAELIDMLLVRMATELESADYNSSSPPAVSHQDVDNLAADTTPDINQRAQLEHSISAFAASEKQRRNDLETRLAEIAARQSGGGGSGEELHIPKERFTAYLRQRFPDDPALEVSALTIIPGGRSKGTLLLETRGAQGEGEIVIRLDFSSMVTGVSVAYEYPVVNALYQAGVPVPEPLWLEEKSELTGGAFVAYAKMSGTAMGTLFHSDAPAAFVREYARVLAQVHSIDVENADLADKLTWGDAAHPVREMVNSFYQRYRNELTRLPLVDTAFAWLYLQLDNIGNRKALVHGDAGLHNTLGDGGRLSALLDWELAHAGHPAEDLCYCKQVVEGIMPWDDFMSAYQEAGGSAISPHEVAFFSVWRSLQLAIQCLGTRQMFTSGVDQDLRIAAIGYNTLPKFLNILATDLAKFTVR
ncbi:MAG: phosphotransferase family protein [Porticoccaceae bacterium]